MRRPAITSLLNMLSRAHHGRAVLLALGRSTQPEDVEIAAVRTRLVAQGLTPIELAALEAEMRETAERLRRALTKNRRRRPRRARGSR